MTQAQTYKLTTWVHAGILGVGRDLIHVEGTEVEIVDLGEGATVDTRWVKRVNRDRRPGNPLDDTFLVRVTTLRPVGLIEKIGDLDR